MAGTDPAGDVLERARRAAARAVADAGVEVREVSDLADLATVRRVFDEIWRPDPSEPLVTVDQLRAYAWTGQYVVNAHDVREPHRPVIAASVGFLAAPPGRALHSHITGVLPGGRGRALGHAIKVHQRAWALERGLDTITWTFDPLIRRNAWFNLGEARGAADVVRRRLLRPDRRRDQRHRRLRPALRVLAAADPGRGRRL